MKLEANTFWTRSDLVSCVNCNESLNDCHCIWAAIRTLQDDVKLLQDDKPSKPPRDKVHLHDTICDHEWESIAPYYAKKCKKCAAFMGWDYSEVETLRQKYDKLRDDYQALSVQLSESNINELSLAEEVNKLRDIIDRKTFGKFDQMHKHLSLLKRIIYGCQCCLTEYDKADIK